MLAICTSLSFTPPVPEKNILSTLPSPLNEVQPSPFCELFAQVKSHGFFFPFFFLFLVLLALVSSANTVGHRAEHSHSPDGARDVGDTLSPHHPIWA